MQKKIRPILKWAGGKYNCIERLKAVLPEGKRLIEPFAGAATVFFNTQYPAYLLGEKNYDLINFYKQIILGKDAFIHDCKRYFRAENNRKERYYEHRKAFNQCKNNDKKRAALFLYLNRHGYNGLCRYNRSGGYNVPFGHHKRAMFPIEAMQQLITRAACTELVNTDFRDIFKQAQKGDVIYCDPPYVPEKAQQTSFNYQAQGFSLQDQIDLAHLARETSQKGIPVLISNHDTNFTRAHYEGADIQSFTVTRHISCKVETRKPAKELIAIFKPCLAHARNTVKNR